MTSKKPNRKSPRLIKAVGELAIQALESESEAPRLGDEQPEPQTVIDILGELPKGNPGRPSKYQQDAEALRLLQEANVRGLLEELAHFKYCFTEAVGTLESWHHELNERPTKQEHDQTKAKLETTQEALQECTDRANRLRSLLLVAGVPAVVGRLVGKEVPEVTLDEISPALTFETGEFFFAINVDKSGNCMLVMGDLECKMVGQIFRLDARGLSCEDTLRLAGIVLLYRNGYKEAGDALPREVLNSLFNPFAAG